MDKNTLKEMLMLYGAEMQNWPEDERQEAQILLTEKKELNQLVDEQAAFDALAAQRPILKENPVFVQNIIAMAAAEQAVSALEQKIAQQHGGAGQTKPHVVKRFFSELLGIFVLPKPVYALMACAVLGFFTGVYSSDIVPMDVAHQQSENGVDNGIELSFLDAMSGVSDGSEYEEGYDMGDWL